MSGAFSVPDQTRSRYPGTRPFSDSPEDVAKFFGRSTETEELYLRVLSVPLLVQFGKSGLGKTSLLQAGLFPLLRKRAFLPVMVRLNVESEPLLAAVQRAIADSCALEGLKHKPEPVAGLWDLLDDLTIWRRDLLLTPVLVFDQFEEVFTLRDAAFRRELAEQLGALATGIPPRGTPPTGATPDLKLIISLREDYLGSLEEFSAAIPGLFHERLRLEPLGDQSARTAITAPALLEGVYDSPLFEFDDATLDAMIAYLKGRSGVIEPFQLQLLARSAERVATRKAGAKREKVTLTLGDFQQGRAFASVLDRFYTDTLNKLSKPQRRRAARLCEEGLLGAGGHRLMLEQRQILDDYRVAPETLKTLADERLIRREPRQESVFYEISHDRLAESIRNARETKMPRKAKRLLWAAALTLIAIFAGLTLWNRAVSRERDKAHTSLARAEGLNSFLLGEQFLGEIREGGRSSLLKLVQSRINPDELTPFNRGLALRNRGDIERATGRIGVAIAQFSDALKSFDARSDDMDVVREAARTHQRLADARTEAGPLSEALSHQNAAVAAWRRVIDGPDPVTPNDCASLAGDLVGLAEVRHRTGQSQRALAELESASEIIFQMLFGHGQEGKKCASSNSPDVYPSPDALQVLSRVVLADAMMRDDDEAYAGAVALASQASSLDPPSIAARQQVFATRAMRGNGRVDVAPLLAIADYRAALEAGDVLLRWDPANREWQRERAANQLLLAGGILACQNQPETKCNPMPSLDTAQAVSLEALATMRELAALDPGNDSFRGDVSWAYSTYASTMAPQERVTVLDEAVRVAGDVSPDDPDADRVARHADLLFEKAGALRRAGRIDDARNLARKVRETYTKLAAAHPENWRFVASVGVTRFLESEILEQSGDSAGARRAKAEAEQSSARVDAMQNPRNARLKTLEELDVTHWTRGVELANGGDHAGAIRELTAAERAGREYARARPAHFGSYRDLSDTYRELARSYKALDDPDAEGTALRAAMHAAQLALWLAPEDAASTMTYDVGRTHLSYGGYLLDRDNLPASAAMIQEGIAVLRPLVGKTSDARHELIVGDANCVLGDIRFRANQGGWEEVYRSGIIYLKRAAALDPRYAANVRECESSLRKAATRPPRR